MLVLLLLLWKGSECFCFSLARQKFARGYSTHAREAAGLAAAASHTECSPKFPQRPTMHIPPLSLSDVIRPNRIGDDIPRKSLCIVLLLRVEGQIAERSIIWDMNVCLAMGSGYV